MVVGSETELPIGRTRLGAVRALARHLVREAGAAIRERGRYVLAIPGGNTPAPLFRVLESQYSHRIDWLHVHLLWTDERAVPPRDPRSNFGTGWKDGIGRLPLPPGQIYRIPCGDRTPEEARDTYESELAELIRPRPGAVGTGPDAVVLGVGTDGHTASLFPGSTSLEAEGRWVVTEPSPPMDP
ncbi:MAG: 6-phosphogluconolactonase, partial [Thermoplasmata archaeon]